MAILDTLRKHAVFGAARCQIRERSRQILHGRHLRLPPREGVRYRQGMPHFIAYFITVFLSLAAFAELPTKHLTTENVYLFGRGSELNVFASSLLKLSETTRVDGRLLLTDLRGMRYPLQRLKNFENRAVIDDLDDLRKIRSETGIIIDVLFPWLSWTRYQSIVGNVVQWSSQDTKNRRVWRVRPQNSSAQHALWLVDLRTGYALVLRLP